MKRSDFISSPSSPPCLPANPPSLLFRALSVRRPLLHALSLSLVVSRDRGRGNPLNGDGARGSERERGGREEKGVSGAPF